MPRYDDQFPTLEEEEADISPIGGRLGGVPKFVSEVYDVAIRDTIRRYNSDLEASEIGQKIRRVLMVSKLAVKIAENEKYFERRLRAYVGAACIGIFGDKFDQHKLNAFLMRIPGFIHDEAERSEIIHAIYHAYLNIQSDDLLERIMHDIILLYRVFDGYQISDNEFQITISRNYKREIEMLSNQT